MRNFKNQAAQGDLLIRRVNSIPNTAKLSIAENGVYVVAHSETGHHHVVKETTRVKLYDTNDPLVSYLEVIEATDASEVLIEHLRSYDTHESLCVPIGLFEIRRQREYTPKGWRRVAD